MYWGKMKVESKNLKEKYIIYKILKLIVKYLKC